MVDFSPTEPLHTPVLFVVFNRPETTAQVFEEIRKAKPLKLYLAADGPRLNVPTDADKCLQVKEILSHVDWPCEVKTLYRQHNIGCGAGVSSAITWLFENEERGIILEDDCLPSQSFFWYCQDLLTRYQSDTRIMHIGGNNFLYDKYKRVEYSYYFARNAHVWGWATWRRAWRYFDHDLKNFKQILGGGYFNNFFLNPFERFYRLRKLKQLPKKKSHIWDYHWDFARYTNSGLSIVPNQNLVRNLGFGNDATHTRGKKTKYAKLIANEISLPLRHPPLVIRDIECEENYWSMLMKDIVISKLMLR